MKPRFATPLSSSTQEWLPLLAAAVVQQAIADAFDPTLPVAVRRDARHFLAGNAEYRFWGQVAEGRARN
jgi:hypothetical protein